MGRLEDKLARAAGVVPRLQKAIEDDADRLIAREDELTARKNAAFAAHNTVIDAQNRSLNQLEDAVKIIENGAPPLPDTSPATETAAKPADTFQPTH